MASKTRCLPDGREPHALEIERVKIRLHLAEALHPGFLHGAGLHKLLTYLCGGPLPAGLIPRTLESGHVRYAEGDAYDFVLTAVGEERRHLAGLEKALRAAGRETNRPGPKYGKPGACFEVAAVEALPAPDLEAAMRKADGLAAAGRVRIRLLSPLRMRRPSFKAELWARYQELSGNRGDAALPLLAKVRPDAMVRLDLPLDPRTQLRQALPAPTVISGQGGTMVAENLPPEWLLLLVLMEDLGAGTANEYGFGVYATGDLPEWHRPALTFEEGLWPAAITPEAAVEALCPAATALLDEGAASYSRGLSCATAEGGRQRAKEQGMNGPVGGVGERFAASLGEEEIMARLEALWPGEPLVARFRPWLREPAAKRKLVRLLAKIFAVELADTLQEEGRRLVRMGSELRVLGRESARVA